jgi:hypothetical protein
MTIKPFRRAALALILVGLPGIYYMRSRNLLAALLPAYAAVLIAAAIVAFSPIIGIVGKWRHRQQQPKG